MQEGVRVPMVETALQQVAAHLDQKQRLHRRTLKLRPPQEYAEHESILVAEVDCTGAGKSKCDDAGVEGFPTLKRLDGSGQDIFSRSFQAECHPSPSTCRTCRAAT